MITFLRIDDRMIHGQTCTRWALEHPCDGLIAVNDDAASNPVLKAAYQGATPDKKTFVWTMDHFRQRCQRVIDSKDRYFLITKDPIDMKRILVDQGYRPGIDRVTVGPCNDRPGAVKLGNNQSITQDEAEALEAIANSGYVVEFALLKEKSIGEWPKFRRQFGFS